MKAHRRTHNKAPGSRKQRSKRLAEKSNKEPETAFEMIEVKDEELDLNYEETYEEEFITDD